MEWVITFITLVAGIVTIIWFNRDVRKENSKILKAILETEQKQTTALEKISTTAENVSKMLIKAEQNHVIAFEKISTTLEKTSTALEKISEMLLNQTKILEKIASK